MKKQHYYLLVGHVIFTPKDSEEAQALTCNAVLALDSQRIGANELSRMQRTIYIRASQLTNNEITIHNLTVQNFMHMGHMTDKEFNNVEITQDLNAAPVTPDIFDSKPN